MKTRPYRDQSGFALLIFLVVLMGIGGVVLVEFGQSAVKEIEKKKFVHNQRVLNEAKWALLQFAFNYPATDGKSPGRLPCADTDNDGIPNTAGACALLGRVPWLQANLNLPDLRDADGQRLWYAVSNNFDTNTGGVAINSDTVGSITIRDQSGNVIYDGSTNGGVAAVIIAPGAITARNGVAQDRVVTNGIDDPFDALLDTDSAIIDPVNYLDQLVGVEDNADFLHDSATNGFILGPVNSETNNAINDQIILITKAEIVEMAEKAVLQTYRNAINDYQQNIWGATAANYRYPWLDPYDSADDLFTYDAEIPSTLPISDPIMGRLPSIFGEYFTANLSQPIKSEINLLLNVDSHQGLLMYPASVGPDVFFQLNGDLRTPFNIGDSFTRYFWDGHDTTPDVNSPVDGIWELCPVVTNDEEDCNRDTSGNFMGGTDSDVLLKVRLVTFTVAGVTFGGPYEVPFVNKTATLTTYTPPNSASHGYITAEYGNSAVFFSSVTYIQDDEFLSSFGEDPVPNNGNLTLTAADTISISLRYYPELPNWAQANLWHDNIMLAYSAALQAGGDGVCTPPVLPFSAVTNLNLDYCLVLANSGGVANDLSAMLFLSGTSPGLVDGAGAPEFFADDLDDIFEGENATPAVLYSDNAFWTAYHNPSPLPADYERLETNLIFDRRPANDTGNDVILSLE